MLREARMFICHTRCKAVFVDTDDVPGKESRVGDLIQNEVEAELVFQVCISFAPPGFLNVEYDASR